MERDSNRGGWDRRTYLKTLGVGAAAATAGCLDQDSGGYPSQEISYIVPYGAGGGFDRYSRIIAKHLKDSVSVDVPVQNKPGSGGVVGLKEVANADPNGYTISTFPSEFISLFQQLKDVGFDITEMTYYGQYATTEYTLVTHAESDIDSFDQFVARVEDGDISVGVDIPQGDGLYLGIWGEITGLYPGAQVMQNLLPYEGTSTILPALKRGEVDVTIRSVASMRKWIEEGSYQPLLVGTDGEPPAAFSEADTFSSLDAENPATASRVTYQTRPIVGPPDVPEDHVETLGGTLMDIFESDGYESDIEAADLTYGSFADGQGAAQAVREKVDDWSGYVDTAQSLLEELN